MRRILLLAIVLFCLPAQAQNPSGSALFIAEAGMLDFEFDGAYIIPFGTNAGIEQTKTPVPLFAFYDADRLLDDHHIGMGQVERIEPDRTIITPFFKTGRTPRIGERILVDLTIRLPNPYYRSLPHRLASNAITMTDISGNILLDLESFEDDGLYMEYMILSFLRDDLVKTSLGMRGQMDNVEIPGGRFKGKRLLDVMANIALKDVEDFILFFNAYPGYYIGYGHIFSEMVALWIVQETPEAPAGKQNIAPSSLGIQLVDDPEADYPKVDRVSQAYYGSPGQLIVPGSHILYMGGKSMRQRRVADMAGMLEGEKYQSVMLSVQTPDMKTFDIEIPYMPLPDNPGWRGQMADGGMERATP